MAVRALLSTILTTALRRGWLSERAAENVASLVDHGLHPEQALVGTKLLTLDQYAELLSEASGLPYVQLPAESAHELTEPELIEHLEATKSVPLIGGQNEIWLGHAEPHRHHIDALHQKLSDRGMSTQSYVISHADWKRQQDAVRKPTSSVRDFFERASQRHSQHVTLCESNRTTDVHWKRHAYGAGEQWPRSLMSELIALFRRQPEYQGWILENHVHGGHRCLHLQRVMHHEQVDHPVDWSQTLRQFLREPKGVLLIDSSDPYLLRKLSHRFATEDDVDPSASSGQSDNEPVMHHIQHEEEREDALHESLLGRPLVIVDQFAPWKQRLQSSGIPLVCLSPSRHPEGIAWCITRQD